jgi:glycine/D-amino acid oxidase-like deaminating enzyme
MADIPLRADVVVVGTGIAGAATAYFLARSGVNVVLVDRCGPAAEASGGNAGMIGESGGDPATTMQLQQRSVHLYRELAREGGDDFELVMGGRLRLAITDDEVSAFEALIRRSGRDGVEGYMLHGDEVRHHEPALSDRVLAAAWFPGDGKLHPVKATNAFTRAARARGATVVKGVRITSLRHAGGRMRAVTTDAGEIEVGEVVLAAGAWTPQLAATAGVHVPVYPGKGHMLATESLPRVTSRVLRAERLGTRQLANGEMLVGSEVEHAGYDKSVNPRRIEEYLAFMQALVPSLQGARVARSWGCLRPMSIDHLPIVGPVPGVAGLHVNTGHGRSGMGLAPASAEALVEVMLTGRSGLDIAAYAMQRFSDTSVSDRNP